MNTEAVERLNRALHENDPEQAQEAVRTLYAGDQYDAVGSALQAFAGPLKADSLRAVFEAAPDRAVNGLVTYARLNGGIPAIIDAVDQGWAPYMLQPRTIGELAQYDDETAVALLERVDHLQKTGLDNKPASARAPVDQLDVSADKLEMLIEPFFEQLQKQSDFDSETIRQKIALDVLYSRDVDALGVVRSTIGLPDYNAIRHDSTLSLDRFDSGQAGDAEKARRAQTLTRLLVDEYGAAKTLSWYVDDRFEHGLQAFDQLNIDVEERYLRRVYEEHYDTSRAELDSEGKLFLVRRLGEDLPADPEILESLIGYKEVELVERFCEQHPDLVEFDHLHEAVRRCYAPGMTGPILDCLEPTNEQLNRAATNMIDFAFEEAGPAISLLPLMQLIEAGLEPTHDLFEFLIEVPEMGGVGDKTQYERTLRMILKTGYRPPQDEHNSLYERMYDDKWRRNGGTAPLRVLAEHDIKPSVEFLERNDGLFDIIEEQLNSRDRNFLEAQETIKKVD